MARFPKLKVFAGQKSMLRHYCIQNVKERVYIQICNIGKGRVSHFSQFVLVKVRKILRKFQAQLRETLRRLKLRENDGFLIRTNVNTF